MQVFQKLRLTRKGLYFCLAIVPRACSDPGGISNGRGKSNSTESSPFPIGTVLTFHCLAGYKLVGSKQRQCMTDGNWSKIKNPTCEGKKQNKSTPLLVFKDDFQPVLRTLQSLLAFFCFVSCKTSQNVCNYSPTSIKRPPSIKRPFSKVPIYVPANSCI